MIKDKLQNLFRYLLGILRIAFRFVLSPILSSPDFIIIGVQKGGTTSLYSNLVKHPSIVPSFKKEVHFFDLNYKKGVNWYKAHFPTKIYLGLKKFFYRKAVICGEATPYYIRHPYALQRIKKHFPNMKLIVVFRDPVYRTYSHYKHEVAKKREHLSFQEAIKEEEKRIKPELERMEKDPYYYGFNHHRFSYLLSSRYDLQVANLFSLFLKEQVLLLKSEDFFKNPEKVYKIILDFLDVPEWYPKKFAVKNINKSVPKKIDAKIETKLRSYFQPYINRFYELIGQDFKW